MSTLSNIDLEKKINTRDIVIIPYNESLITGLGYDLTIGTIVDLDDQKITECTNGKYCLKGKHRYVVITNEYVWLSRKYMATLHARGSLSLMGISLTSTTVDPNFRGYMPMCLTNLSDRDIEIEKNESFVTLIIHILNTPTDKKIGTLEDGTLRIAERKISELFEDNDNRKTHLFEYLAKRQQQYRNDIDELVNKADNLNKLSQFISKSWKNIPYNFKKIISCGYYVFMALIFVILFICIWTLAIDDELITKILPNFNKDNALLITAIITIAALIINKYKK